MPAQCTTIHGPPHQPATSVTTALASRGVFPACVHPSANELARSLHGVAVVTAASAAAVCMCTPAASYRDERAGDSRRTLMQWDGVPGHATQENKIVRTLP